MGVKVRQRRRPASGAEYVGLVVGTRERLAAGIPDEVARQVGIGWRYRWDPGGPLPLARRPVPDDVELVLIFTDPAVKRKDRADLATRLRRERPSIFVLQAWPNAPGIIADLAKVGFHRHAFDMGGLEARKPAARPLPESTPPSQAQPETHHTGAPEMAEKDRQSHISAADRARMKAAGRALKERRKLAGVSHVQLSKLLLNKDPETGKIKPTAHTYISAIETGRMAPATRYCEALEFLFGLPPGTFPRLATRDNHRLIMPEKRLLEPEGSTPAPAPRPAAPTPPPPSPDKAPPGVRMGPTIKPQGPASSSPPGAARAVVRSEAPAAGAGAALGEIEAILQGAERLRERLGSSNVSECRIDLTAAGIKLSIAWPAPPPPPAASDGEGG